MKRHWPAYPRNPGPNIFSDRTMRLGRALRRWQAPTGLNELKHDMHDALFARRIKGEPTLSEHLQHGRVFRQHFGDKFFDPGHARNDDEVTQQRRTQSLALILVDDGTSYLRPSGRNRDITANGDDHSTAFFFDDCNQGNMVGEIDIQEKRDFGFRKAGFYSEKASVERLRTCTFDSGQEAGFILRPESTNLDGTPIGETLCARIIRCFKHRRAPPSHQPFPGHSSDAAEVSAWASDRALI